MRTRLRPALGAGAFLLCHVVAPLAAQPVELSTESEAFRKTPGGRPLGEVLRGTRLALVRTEGEWSEVALDGWLPTSSLARTTREGFNRVVSSVGGESLRDGPEGAVVARLLQGFLLDEVEAREGWTRVRRSGWVRRVALTQLGVGAFARPAGDSTARPRPLMAEGRQVEA
ncbi:MAG: hypothetical protein ACRELC_10865, partial [Gemmatimonadota bacterium]